MAQSPFAVPTTKTYKYPEPLDDKKDEDALRIDPEQLELHHWLKLRIPLSKADVDSVADFTQSAVILGDNGDGAKVEQRIARGNRGVFELLAESWSFDAECNSANFARLAVWAADWVSACLADAVQLGTTRDYAKKMKDSSEKPEPSPTSSQQPEPTASE